MTLAGAGARVRLRLHRAALRVRRPAWLARLAERRVVSAIERGAQPSAFWARRLAATTTAGMARHLRRQARQSFWRQDDEACQEAKSRLLTEVEELEIAASLGSSLAIRRLEQLQFNYLGDIAAQAAANALRRLEGRASVPGGAK